MSRFFPHSAYAEDQPFPRTILTVHVLSRGFEAGALIGPVIGLPRYLISRPISSTNMQSLTSTLLRSMGVGSAVGTGLLSVGLIARMWNKEPIEWADRSWRLLENRGQVEVDDWSYAGAILGITATSVAKKNVGWRGLIVGTGLGSLLGIGGYMIYRYGIKGGKWEDDDESLLS